MKKNENTIENLGKQLDEKKYIEILLRNNNCFDCIKDLKNELKKDIKDQIKLRIELFNIAKNIENNEFRKVIFANLREIKKRQDNSIDCTQDLLSMQSQIIGGNNEK
jgi:hypothetical protein